MISAKRGLKYMVRLGATRERGVLGLVPEQYALVGGTEAWSLIEDGTRVLGA
jgi:hypothetical protein